MTEQTRNKGFVATGGGMVIVAIVIVLVIWFLVTRTSRPVKPDSTNSNASDTGSTQGIPPDSLHH